MFSGFCPKRLENFLELVFYFVPGDLDISVLSNYITHRKNVYPAVEGRIKIYNAAPGLPTSPLVLLVPLGLFWTRCGSV